MKTNNATNPFETLTTATTESTTRKLSYTNELIARANERATETIKKASENAELHALANRMMDGDPNDLVELFKLTEVQANVEADAQLLAGASEDELKRLLESRRSDRSKLKSKGIRSSMAVCRGYVSAMYAELMVRQAMGKPYTGSVGVQATDVDTDDLDAVNRKIKSLQSKKCRLHKLAEAGDAGAQDELAATVAEIERLRGFRPTTQTSTTIKSVKVDVLREALASLKPEDMPEELVALMAKIG